MTEIDLILNVVFLFLFRIGFPLLVLVILGIVIERWQHKLHANDQQNYRNANA